MYMSEKKQLAKPEEKKAEALEPSGGSLFSRLIFKYKARKAKKLAQIESIKLSDEESKKIIERIEEANKEVSHSNSKKKKIQNICFFVFNIVLVAGILLWNIFSNNEDFEPLSLKNMNLLYVFFALLFLFFIVCFDVLTVHRMIYRKTLRSRWFLAYKATATLRYYDAVTPLSAGGQAFMVTYLTGRDIPATTSLSVPIAKLLFQQIAWLIISFVCLIISFAKGMTTLVSAASIIGFVLTFCLVVIILFMSLSKKWGKKVISWGLKALVKMKILKNYDKHYAKVMSFVEDYQNIMKEYSKSKMDVVYQVILSGARFVLLFSIPYFIYMSFPYQGGKIGSFDEFFVYTALIDLASSFIPLPGGTGMNEITFTFLFKEYLGGSTFWALLLWRFCSYYFYLLQGIGVITYDTLIGNKKYRWTKKKFDLQEESQVFRRMQIENFRFARDKRRKKQKKMGLDA